MPLHPCLSMNLCLPRTLRILLQVASLCLFTLLASAVSAQALPAAVKASLPEASVTGSGKYTWFGLSLYDARLWADKKSFAAPNWQSASVALELVYARRLVGERIAVASIDEIRKLGIGTAAQQEAWLGAMKALFPDVDEGTQLIGVYAPGQPTRFFRDGTPIGEVADPAFGPAFFGIWLHPKTSAPKLRTALLGSK